MKKMGFLMLAAGCLSCLGCNALSILQGSFYATGTIINSAIIGGGAYLLTNSNQLGQGLVDFIKNLTGA